MGSTVTAASSETEKFIKQLKTDITEDEKAKLYSAIGYEKNAKPALYPETFVENRFEFALDRLVVLLHERDCSNVKQPDILLSRLSGIKATVEQRPVAQALHVNVKVGNFVIDGSPQNDVIPSLVRPMEGNN